MSIVKARKMPRQQRAQVTVDALLEAAAHILERQGWEALSTNAVAQKAGASIGSLYQYFPGKEAIIAELIRRERAGLLEALDEAVADATGRPWMEGVAALVTVAVDHQLARPRLSSALDYAEHILPLADETAAINAAIAATLSRLLHSYHISAPDIAAKDIAALCRGLIDAAGMGGEQDREALRRRALRAAWGYLTTSEASIRNALK